MAQPVKICRIGTRASRLAQTQARLVAGWLKNVHPELEYELKPMTTRGDRHLDDRLQELGGKGLFVKEIEAALIAGEIDLAVHSAKDMPSQVPDGLTIAGFGPRENPADALITRGGETLNDLPAEARIGTSSLRRGAQLKHWQRSFRIEPVRGNVETRLEKLKRGGLDALVLAVAGLNRLDLSERVAEQLPVDLCVPAAGQGALALQIREDDQRMESLLEPVLDRTTTVEVRAERAFLHRLNGDCKVPVGALGRIDSGVLKLKAVIAAPSGKQMVKDEISGSVEHAADLGQTLAERLLNAGGRAILAPLLASGGGGADRPST